MDDRQLPEASAPPGPPPRTTVSPAPAGQPDDGQAIMVRFNSWAVGDLGHPDVDLQIVDAVLARHSQVGKWLAECGVDRQRLHREFGAPPDLGDMLERSGRG